MKLRFRLKMYAGCIWLRIWISSGLF